MSRLRLYLAVPFLLFAAILWVLAESIAGDKFVIGEH